MAELKDFDQQDLINIQKVMSIDKSDKAAYRIEDKVYSAHQNEQTVYRVYTKGEDHVYMYVFNKHNKLVNSSKETIEPVL